MRVDTFAELTITTLQGGGYVVSNAYRAFREDRPFVPVFACSTLDEALDFIRENLVTPPTPNQNSRSEG